MDFVNEFVYCFHKLNMIWLPDGLKRRRRADIGPPSLLNNRYPGESNEQCSALIRMLVACLCKALVGIFEINIAKHADVLDA